MKEQVLIVGAGNMGSALARGLSKQQILSYCLYDQNSDRLAALQKDLGCAVMSSLDAVASFHAIVLCVKPQDLPGVAATIKDRMAKDTLIISILAGVTIADIGEAFGYDGPVVRAMPNICATVGEAATVVACHARVSASQKSLVDTLFGAIGECHVAEERLMDAVTGLSGSGPAYLYMVIEALTDGGVKMGLPRRLAFSLATQTVLGSAVLVKESGIHPAILREQVTTPGGTTINATYELEERGLRAMLMHAVQTATERSADLRGSAKKSKS